MHGSAVGGQMSLAVVAPAGCARRIAPVTTRYKVCLANRTAVAYTRGASGGPRHTQSGCGVRPTAQVCQGRRGRVTRCLGTLDIRGHDLGTGLARRAGMRRVRRRSPGFTMIELMVVVAILGVLVAIAIPEFAGRQGKAYDARVMQDARNAATAEEAYFDDRS